MSYYTLHGQTHGFNTVRTGGYCSDTEDVVTLVRCRLVAESSREEFVSHVRPERGEWLYCGDGSAARTFGRRLPRAELDDQRRSSSEGRAAAMLPGAALMLFLPTRRGRKLRADLSFYEDKTLL